MLRILNEFFFKKLTFLKRLNRRQSGGLPTWRGMVACFNTRTPERLVITDKTVRMLSVKFTWH